LKFYLSFLKSRPPNAVLVFENFTREYCKRGQEGQGFYDDDAKGKRKEVLTGPIVLFLDPADTNGSRAQAKAFLNEFFEDTKTLRKDKCAYLNFNEEARLEDRASREVQDRFEKIKWHYDPQGFFGSKF